MSQNRNKLIDLFIGNISNAIVHEILEKAIDDEQIRDHYSKEWNISLEIAKRYRENINPVNKTLPEQDIEDIKLSITKKVNQELELRISKGYENIDLSLIESVLNKLLKKTKIIE